MFDIWNISFVFFDHGEDELCPESESAAYYIFSSVGGSCTSFRNCSFWARSRLLVRCSNCSVIMTGFVYIPIASLIADKSLNGLVSGTSFAAPDKKSLGSGWKRLRTRVDFIEFLVL